METMRDLLLRVQQDADFAALVRRDPDAAATGYALSDDELASLRRLDSSLARFLVPAYRLGSGGAVPEPNTFEQILPPHEPPPQGAPPQLQFPPPPPTTLPDLHHLMVPSGFPPPPPEEGPPPPPEEGPPPPPEEGPPPPPEEGSPPPPEEGSPPPPEEGSPPPPEEGSPPPPEEATLEEGTFAARDSGRPMEIKSLVDRIKLSAGPERRVLLQRLMEHLG